MWKSAGFCVLAAAVSLVVAGKDYYPVDFVENIDNPEAWQSRIVSGWEARPGQHPHQVSLRMINLLGSVSSCGGSVVAREWVITSAHCTATRITLVVRAGVTSLTRPEFIVESSLYYNYPTFDSSRPGVVQPDDIALVRLPVRLVYSRNLQPIRIQSSADAHRNYEDLIVYASGFGRTWTNGPLPEQLHWTYLRAVSNPTCAQVFGSRIITPNTICARFYNVTSQSVCQGDSGGPLVHVDSRGVPVLVGVSSFVAGEPFGCHSGLPAGFARPGPFHSWYKDVTEIDFENLNEDEDTTTTTTTTTTNSTTSAPTTVTTVTVPTLTTPNVTVPTVTVPTMTTPNMTTPNITIPTVTVPTMTTPNMTTPNITIPTVTVPTMTTPNMTTPNITIPTVTVPTMTTPNMTTPIPTVTFTFATTTVPSITTPNMTISTTTPTPPTTTPTPEGDDSDEDDPELSELLKKLEVKVGVVVRLTKRGRNKKLVLVE